MPAGPGTRQEYQHLVSEFAPNKGHLMPCLHKVQHHYGYIPNDAIPVIARQLGMNTAELFGAITFYSEFRITPPPRLLVNWCSGPTCRLKGGDGIRKALEATLDIKMEENFADNSVGLHLQQCDGSCEFAPLVWLRRYDRHAEGPFATLVDERGEVRGPLRVADAVEMGRRLREGDLEL